MSRICRGFEWTTNALFSVFELRMEAVLDPDDFIMPPSAISFAKLLLADAPTWDKMQTKDRLPKPKPETVQEVETVYAVLNETVRRRTDTIKGSRAVSLVCSVLGTSIHPASSHPGRSQTARATCGRAAASERLSCKYCSGWGSSRTCAGITRARQVAGTVFGKAGSCHGNEA